MTRRPTASLCGAILCLLSALACNDDASQGSESASESSGESGSTDGPETGTGTDPTDTDPTDTDPTDTDPTDTDPTGPDPDMGGPDPLPPAVWLSEVMYHPVLEDDYVDHHEFVEVHNPGAEAIMLGGWTISGGITYVFPPDAVIEPGEYLAIAKDPAALAAEYGLDAASVLGPYERELDNGDESLTLRRDDDSLADILTYDDGFPWPLAADAFGAGESWLRPELLPLEDHRYRGVSLERLSMLVPTNEISNWVPSATDSASPGQAYAAPNDDPPPILTYKLASTASELIRAGEEVNLDLVFSDYGTLTNVRVDWFVDDVQVMGEPVTSVDIPDADFIGRAVSIVLPGQPKNSIVRWRVFGDRGNGVEQISPRPSDPHDYHAYFVSPVVQSNSPYYELFLSTNNWTQMWTNIQGGREIGCEKNPTWDNRVTGVLVSGGEVHDVQVRYQGSRWNRGNGPQIQSWPYPGPSQPSPLRGLSYRVAFPRYNKLDGRDVLTLNKLTQGCPGLAAGVGFELFRRLGIPAPITRFVRLYINGGYYRYMMEIEHPDEDMMAAYHEANAVDPMNVEPVGHLFKSVGLNADAGPFGWGDARPLNDYCGHSAYTRYTYTYDRKTYDWATHDDLIAMMEELNSYRNPNTGAIDTIATQLYLEANFDVDMVMDHIAVMNWSVPFDDYFQNHFLYRRRGDDMWIMMPWDLDQNFGPWANSTGAGAQASIFGGRNGQDAMGGINANRAGWWNRIKDSFLRTYEDEFITLMKMHADTTLHPTEIAAIVDEVVASYSLADAWAASSPPSCDIINAANTFKAFAQARHDYIVNTPANQLINW